MKIFAKSILLFFFIINTSNAELKDNNDPYKSNAEIKYWILIKPKPALKPIEVVLIQLNSLKNNDNHYKDYGVEQTWEFAHPNNKLMTGPLNKFKKMIYSESYEMLINHENHKVILLKKTNNVFTYKVFILSKDKKKYSYIWQVEKVSSDDNLKNCWMTTSVSNLEYLGEVI
jgi:hypothetical protein